MRALLLALFVGLASARVDENAFEQGRVYTFRYEAQLVTGSPASGRLWGGLRLTANLKLYFITATNVTAKLTHVDLQKMDKFVEDRTPSFFMQPEKKLLDGIEADVNSIMVTELEKDFSFTWNKGHVNDVWFGHNVPAWCANIKRGVIGLTEVNLDCQNCQRAVQDDSSAFNPMGPSYTVWENSVSGYCRTIYTPKVNAMPGRFYLTKVRDYSSCLKISPMDYVFNNFRSEKDNHTKHLDLQGEVSYAIKGDKSGFIIMTAMGESKIVFVPYSHEDGNVQTAVNQTLYLWDAEDISNPPPFPVTRPPPREECYPLQMELPMENARDNSPYQFGEQPNPSDPNKPLWTLAKMEQLLSWVANGTHDYPSPEVLMTMQTLTEMIRSSKHSVLSKLLDKVLNYEDIAGNVIGPLKLKIYWDLLCACGTSNAANVALDYCLKINLLQDPQSQSRCVSAVTSIGLMAPPSESVIRKLIVLAARVFPPPPNNGREREIPEENEQEPDERQQQQQQEQQRVKEVKMVALLAAGALLGRAEDMKEELFEKSQEKIASIQSIVDSDQIVTSDSLKKYVEKMKTHVEEMMAKHNSLVASFAHLIKRQFLRSDEPADVILGLKALRNAHAPDTFQIIKEFLVNRSLQTTVRICAAQALEKFKQKKQEVVQTLEQVLKNPEECASFRIQAFRCLVNVRAPVEVFVRLAESIRHEKERQVSTYVWSAFNKLANCSYRPYRQAAASFRSALSFIQPIEAGLQDSQYHYRHQHLTSGASVLAESSIVSDPDLVFQADAAAYVNLFGSSNKAFQVSWLSESLQPVWKTLMGPKGFFTNRNSLFDLLRRTKRGTNANDIITEIVKKLGIQPREFGETSGFVSLQSLNNVVRIWDVSTILQNIRNLEIVQANIDEQKWRAGVQFNKKTCGIMDQFFKELPTEAGFPVSLQMGWSYTAKVKGVVEAGVKASIYKSTRSFNPPVQVNAGLYIDPQVVGSLMGKMAVDGYIFQSGSVFHAQVDIKTPFTVNATVDLKQSQLNVAISPPVNTDTPVLKLELKPYVYSRAVDQDVVAPRPVNHRPVFHTMQPVMISNGARIQQVKKSFGDTWLGYNVTWQGQHLWPSLPSATSPPMTGRAHYAVYITQGVEQPAILSMQAKYLSQPRYVSPQPADSTSSESSEEIPRINQGACDSWFTFLCYDTDEQDAVDEAQVDDMPSSPPPPLADIPVLGRRVTFQSVKQKIESEVGHEIPPSNSEWGFIVVVNSSSPAVKREAALTGMMQAWKEGQFHQSFFTFTRSPIPTVDPQPWKMTLKTSTILPSNRMAVSELLNPEYQATLQSDMFGMMRRQEHKIINKHFQQLLLTKLSSWAIQSLPSLDPQIMLDRIVPEVCIESSHCPFVRQVRAILQKYLPLAKQLKELRGEMKDAFTLASQQELLEELGQEIPSAQYKIIKVLNKIKRSEKVSQQALLTASYAVQQIGQCVCDFGKIVERAVNVTLLENPVAFIKMKTSINKNQGILYRYSMQALNNQPLANPVDGVKYQLGTSIYDNSDRPSSTESGNPSSVLIENLRALSKEQLKDIVFIWRSMVRNAPIRFKDIMSLIVASAENVTQIDNLFKYQYSKNKDIQDLIFQVATQHKIVVDLISQARFEAPLVETTSLNNVDFYALKVQTKQLLERGLVLQNEAKIWSTCQKNLPSSDQKLVEDLSQIDRELSTLQHKHFSKPNIEDPWTTDERNLAAAEQTMVPILEKLTSIRDKILPHPGMPQPCLMMKLMYTAICLQQKVAVFRRTLCAQFPQPAELTQKYEWLEDATKRFMPSLEPLFNKYSTVTYPDQPNVFPEGNIIISEGMLQITKLHHRQNRVIKQLHKFLFQYGSTPFEVVKRVLQTVANECRELLKRLEEEAERVQNSLRTSTVLTAFTVYAEYLDTLQQQQDIYDTLQQQMQVYAKQPSLPDIGPEVGEAKARTATLMRQASEWQLPSKQHDSIPSRDDLNVFPSRPSIYESEESQAGVYDLYSDNEDSRIQASSEEEDQLKRELPPPLNSTSIIFIANLTYGDQKYMGLQIHGRKSVEQMVWEAAQYYPESRDWCVARALQQDIEDRKRLEKCGVEMERRVNTYQHVHVRVECSEPQLPKAVQTGMDMTMRYVQRKYRHRTTVSPPQSFVRTNAIHTVFDFSDSLESMDVYCMTPQKTLVTQSMPLNSYIPPWYPFQNEVPLAKQVAMETTARHYPAMCMIDHFNVKTNDGAVYTMPFMKNPKNSPSPCRTLLAMDCSSDYTFAITIEPTRYPAQKLQILAEEHQVIIEPNILTDKVTLDGEAVRVQHSQPVVKFKKIAYGKEAVALVISRTRGGILHVEYPLTGLDIYFDFSYIQIAVSSVYKNQLCGLCGNFDGQITEELEGPDPDTFYYAAVDFFKSYVIDKQCKIQGVKKPFGPKKKPSRRQRPARPFRARSKSLRKKARRNNQKSRN